ncbi:MAG: cupin domain-containing protein [Sedimentisphaerales bacterium]|nr:cupin domain-containing protein [Sedimentisphaerales bacterium]
MIVKKIVEVDAVPVQMEGAKDVSVRVLFGPKDAAPTFALRQFEIAVGGHTPFHEHPFEHEVVVMAGEINLVKEDGKIPITVGEVVLIPANEKHQFQNGSSTETAKMLCIVPVEYQK